MTKLKITKCSKVGPDYIEFGIWNKQRATIGDFLARNDYSRTKLDSLLLQSNYDLLIEDNLQKWIVALKQNEAIHNENIPIIELMKAEIEEIHAFMKTKGIEKTYRTINKKSRAFVKPSITCVSNYVEDIKRTYDMSDDFQNVNELCKRNIQNLLRLKDVAGQRKETLKSEKIAKNKMDKNFFEVAKINEELGNPIKDIFTTELSLEQIKEELIDLIVEKNNALSLADAMRQTRENWNDGCSKVKYSIFAPTNEEEKEMNSCVQEAIESFHNCQDGRVFRDCDWNYDQIYLYVERTDPVTYALYNRIENLK